MSAYRNCNYAGSIEMVDGHKWWERGELYDDARGLLKFRVLVFVQKKWNNQSVRSLTCQSFEPDT